MRTEAERTVAGQRVSPVIPSARLVSCPDHTSLEENGLVNQVEFLGLEAH